MQFFAFILALSTLVAAQLQQLPGTKPVHHVGYLIFPGFEALDLVGPHNPLNMLSASYSLKLSIIALTMDPVPAKINHTGMAPKPGVFSNYTPLYITPTHTIDKPPCGLDLLIVPGGMGTRVEENMGPLAAYVRKVYPRLKYLLSICTGATVLARAGVLDGRRATSNKAAFAWVKTTGPKVDWVAKARWVVDGNIWTTSGIAAGIDGTLAFIEHLFGADYANWTSDMAEYERHTDPNWDPYADIWNVTSTNGFAPAAGRKVPAGLEGVHMA